MRQSGHPRALSIMTQKKSNMNKKEIRDLWWQRHHTPRDYDGGYSYWLARVRANEAQLPNTVLTANPSPLVWWRSGAVHSLFLAGH